MKILHTEASNGWGGQEIRILREAIGLRGRGHEIHFAITPGGRLADAAREQGFPVTEVSFDRRDAFRSLPVLRRIICNNSIEVVNTHSSLDAWIAGFAAKMCGVHCLRTRHLSAHIRPGLNSKLLYRWLADGVVTTCEETAATIRRQAGLSPERCRSVPTGIDPTDIAVTPDDGIAFRHKFGIPDDALVVGTLCVLRSWKGIHDLLDAADKLRSNTKLRWLVVGDGPGKAIFQQRCRDLDLEGIVLFTGHVTPPFAALQAMDIFTLLSTGNEGVSQASLQAAYLRKPLITTRTGGLPEVCKDHITGYTVDCKAPEQVASAVLKLANDKRDRAAMGVAARELVDKHFLWEGTLDEMEAMLARIAGQVAAVR